MPQQFKEELLKWIDANSTKTGYFGNTPLVGADKLKAKINSIVQLYTLYQSTLNK